MKNKIFLCEKQVAQLLNVSIKKLQKDRLQQTGLPYHKFGRSVRYRRDEIEAYLQTCKVQFPQGGRDA